MQRVKIVYIVSHIDKANEFEWLITHIDKTKFELVFVSIHSRSKTQLGEFCHQHEIAFNHISYNSKKNIFSAIAKTWWLLRKLRPEVVHAHLFEGGIIGITAAWLARIKHRICTRHHSNYHHKYHPNGLKFDKWVNQRATHIVSITDIVSKILMEKEGVPASKITLIHHGFQIKDFEGITPTRIQQVKQRTEIPESIKIIGVVSRYTHWKGVQDIIPAFKKLHEKNPNTHLVLANAQGDYATEIQSILTTLPTGSYTEIVFEQDNAALFRCFDIFVHTPVDTESEAFGQIYIEAMLSEAPMICTLSGIANEIIHSEVNALVVRHQDSESIYDALCKLIKDNTLKDKLIKKGRETALDFTFERKLKTLESLYSSLL